MNPDQICALVLKAAERISPFIYKTPLEHSLFLSNKTGAQVYFKLESEQKTGSFKVRGALNKLMSEKTDKMESTEFVTASCGNHALACAYAMTTLNKKGIIYISTNASSAKENKLKLYGLEIRKHGLDCLETEKKARSVAEVEGLCYISPYADLQIIAGQGTIGKEIENDLPDVDVVFVAVGGGGSICGIGSYLKSNKRDVEIVGCSAANSPVMHESIKAGHIVDIPCYETLSDGSGGGIEEDSITFSLAQKVVDRWILVDEEEIADALYLMLDKHCKVIEGVAAVALASFLKHSDEYIGKNVVILICGGNISIEKLSMVLNNK